MQRPCRGRDLKYLDRMHGGEIFIPILPSMHILDLVEAMAPGYPREIVGLREGKPGVVPEVFAWLLPVTGLSRKFCTTSAPAIVSVKLTLS